MLLEQQSERKKRDSGNPVKKSIAEMPCAHSVLIKCGTPHTLSMATLVASLSHYLVYLYLFLALASNGNRQAGRREGRRERGAAAERAIQPIYFFVFHVVRCDHLRRRRVAWQLWFRGRHLCPPPTLFGDNKLMRVFFSCCCCCLLFINRVSTKATPHWPLVGACWMRNIL